MGVIETAKDTSTVNADNSTQAFEWYTISNDLDCPYFRGLNDRDSRAAYPRQLSFLSEILNKFQ